MEYLGTTLCVTLERQKTKQDRLPQPLQVDILAITGNVTEAVIEVRLEIRGVQLALYRLALDDHKLRHRAKPLIGLLNNRPAMRLDEKKHILFYSTKLLAVREELGESILLLRIIYYALFLSL